MKNNITLIFLLAALISCKNESAKNEKSVFPILTGQYLGQGRPSLEPTLFASGIISTGKYEFNSAFSPDQTEFYFSIKLPSEQNVILCTKNINKKWIEPEVVPFSGKYSDADPFVSYDGQWIYFVSMRPINESKDPKEDWDIWRVKRQGDSWGEPERLDTTVNSDTPDVYPTLTKNGALYFSSGRDNAAGGRDIFRSELKDNKFQKAERLEGMSMIIGKVISLFHQMKII